MDEDDDKQASAKGKGSPWLLPPEYADGNNSATFPDHIEACRHDGVVDKFKKGFYEDRETAKNKAKTQGMENSS